MNPSTNTPQLDEKQKKQYNAYRAEGMTPERALSLTLQTADQKYSPLSDVGLDRLFFGKGGMVNEVAGGIVDAFTFKGAKEQYQADRNKFQSTADPSIDPDIGGVRAQAGKDYANAKAPLTYGAAFAKGIGRSIFGVLETADDLTGEVVSGTAKPVVDSAVNSDVGQYLIEKAVDFNDKNDGVPGDILELTDLLGAAELIKNPLQKGTAQSIRDSLVKNTRRVVDQGIDSTRKVSRLADYFKPTTFANPIAQQIDDGFKGIEGILAKNAKENVDVAGQLADIKAMIREGGFEQKFMASFDDIFPEDLPLEDRNNLIDYIKKIDEAVNQDGASDVIENYLSGALTQIDSAAAGAVSITERLSDAAIDKTLKTVENVRAVPEAIAGRISQANDRRIVRIATSNTEEALNNIVELYKKGIVPGVKKKNKTIATINEIDEAIKRTVPELAKKYDVQDIEDFANVISLEKKAIFSQIDEGLKAAGEAGKQIDLTPIIAQLDELAKSERANFSTPLKNAIDRARAELVVETPDGQVIVKKISASGAQDLIADLNQALQPQYRGARTNADDVVDFLVVNNLRKLTDDIVEDLGSGKFKDLKAQYADLKKMEDDVVHRAVFEAQKGNGLTSNIADVTSAADVAAGAFSPAFLARAAGGFLTKEVTKALNDKNELVRQMFLYGKNVDVPTRKGGAPVNPLDNAVEDASPDGRFETSPNSEVVQALGDQQVEVATDFTKPVAITDKEIDLFGTKIPLNKLEAEVLNNSDFRLKVDTKKTATGRKSSKQPVAFYSRDTGGITFVPRKDFPIIRTIQTFYHEVGHALDYKGVPGTPISGRATYRTPLRHTGWKLPLEERTALAKERFDRMMKPTRDKYNLTDEQMNDMFRMKRVQVEGGYLPASRKLVAYVRAENELFAEAYSMFRLNPEKLKELSPRTFEFITEIVNK